MEFSLKKTLSFNNWQLAVKLLWAEFKEFYGNDLRSF